MKAKTLRGVIAIASATVSISAFANTTNDCWFSANATGTSQQLVNVSITAGQVEVKDSKFVIDNDDNSPLVFTPAVALTETNSTNISRIDVSAVMTASKTNDFKVTTTSGTPHAGFAVGFDDNHVTNYYGYVNDTWHKFDRVTPVDGVATQFSIILNYRDHKVHFIVGGTELGRIDFEGSYPETLHGLEAFGTGSISSITSSYEVAVAEYAVSESVTNRYGSVAEAMSVAGKSEGGAANYDKIATVGENGDVVPGTGTGGKAANGLAMWECAALGIEQTQQIGLVKAQKQNEGKITLSIPPTMHIEPGVTAKFQLAVDGEEPSGDKFDPDNIQIPMGSEAGSHVYTIVPTITVKQ